MNQFTGVTRETRGGYTIWVNGDALATAKNPTEAAAKLDKELNRHAVNATREVNNAAWEASKYSKSQAQLETQCPDFYSV